MAVTVVVAAVMGMVRIMAVGTVLMQVFAVRAVFVAVAVGMGMNMGMLVGMGGTVLVRMLVHVGVLMLMLVVVLALVAVGMLMGDLVLAEIATAVLAHMFAPVGYR